jgi:hypothetical protein
VLFKKMFEKVKKRRPWKIGNIRNKNCPDQKPGKDKKRTHYVLSPFLIGRDCVYNNVPLFFFDLTHFIG